MTSRTKLKQPRTIGWLSLAAGVWIAIALALPGARTAQGQATWEYAPYQIQVWIGFQQAPELTPRLRAEIEQELRQQSYVEAGATWRVVASPAPEKLNSTLVNALDLVTLADIEAADPDALEKNDKLIMIGVRADSSGDCVIEAREFDCQARLFGRLARRRVRQPDLLVREVFRTAVTAFAPMVRVEDSRGKSATVRVRAGGLIIDENNPSCVKLGDVLQPVIRTNDRLGRPQAVNVIPWHFLSVTESTDGLAGDVHKFPMLFDCQLDTAGRNQLTGRGSVRVKRFAMLVRPTGTTSTLKLISNADPLPLEGYEVFAKRPIAKDGEKILAERLGRTDWRGQIELTQNEEFPMSLIYIKNGTFLVARLPIVPGLDPVVEAPLTNDDKRLEAESFVKGMESTVMDIVARRAILTARIRRRITENKAEDAKALFEEFGLMPTKNDLEQMIVDRQANLSSTNTTEQKRIDNLMAGTRLLLTNFLDEKLRTTLEQEVSTGKLSEVAGEEEDADEVTTEEESS